MTKTFLLPSSFIFDDSNSIDNIHQTFLDLQFNADEQSVQGFLDEAFQYLCTDYQNEVAKELLSAISLCFSLYPQYSLPLADKFLNSSKLNEYLIISSASIVFELTNNKTPIDFPDYHSFIDDCLNEILPQIQDLQSTKLNIFGQEISHQYHNSLILDLLLSAKLTEELFSNYFIYVLTTNLNLTNPKFDILLSKLIEAGYVKIPPLTESSINDLLQFIEMKNINLLDKKCMDTFLFISQVANFTRTEGKSNINGLTEDTVLPFAAITAIYYRSSQFEFTFSEQNLPNFLESIQNLNDKNSTKLNKESINFILKNLDDFESNKLFSCSTLAEIIVILVRKLLKNEFEVDKILLLSILFGYFLKESDKLDTNVKNFVQNDGKSLLDYIFDNIDEINNSLKLQKLNLNVFDKQMLTDYLNSKLESEKQLQTVYFLENFCLNVPNLTVSPEILEKVEKENMKSFLIITRFLKKNLKDEDFEKIKDTIPKNIQISLSDEIPDDDIDIDDLLSYILANSHDNLDKSIQLFNLLFDKMTNDKQMLRNYLLYKIDNSFDGPSIIRYFLEDNIDLYEKFHEDFIEAVNIKYYYSTRFSRILSNASIKLSNLPIPESGINVIDKLFKYANEHKATYQIFLCLKNIASSFPYLFENYFEQIYDLVLPNIDYFYLLVDQNLNEKSLEMAKVAYSSLSFLFSTLKLPSILEKFLDLTITNIFSYTNSQILGFLIVMQYFFEIDDIYEISLMTVKNYNFLETLQILFDREFEEGKHFESLYKETLSSLIVIILKNIADLSSDSLSDIQQFDYSIHPISEFINNMYIKLPNIKIKSPIKSIYFSTQINNFLFNTECQREFWIIYNIDLNAIKRPNEYQINSFSEKLNVKGDFYMPELNDVKSNRKNQGGLFSNSQPYFETLFRIITMESIDSSLYSIFESAISYSTIDGSSLTSYIDFIISYIKEFDENSIGSDSPLSLKVMIEMIEILSIYAQNNKLTLTQAIKILSIVLSPKWRNASRLLRKMIYLLRFYSSLPVSTLHAVEFDVLQNKIVGERDIAIIENICSFEIKQFKINQYYQHYADLDKKTAITIYGILLKDGICTNADIPKALTYIKKAMEFEDPTAIAYYALMLKEGNGVDQNIDESIKLLQKAADKESDIAMNSYGEMLENGINVEKDVEKAVSYYRKAMKKLNMRSVYNFGLIVSTDHEHIYYKTSNNVAYALQFLKMAADQGILDSIYKYGTLKSDAIYIEKAAKKGHPKAVKRYISYIIDDNELSILPENAEWLQKGIELGIKGALFKFSSCLAINNMQHLAQDFNLLDYANEDDINAMTDYHREQWNKKGFTGDTYKAFAQEADQYIDILKQYKKDNTKVFVDENFHPFKNWKRIDELYDVPLFKRELIDPSFIIQGNIGDCCLISALSRAAKQFYLIPELFDYHSPNKILGVVENSMNIKCGAVVINFHVFGRITPVLIDTLVPVTDEGIPLLSHPIDKTKSPWFCLVEKAFIKLNGSFLSIQGIPFEKALYCMYFTYSKIFLISKIGINSKAIDRSTNKKYSLTFEKINEYYNNGCAIHAAIRNRRAYESSTVKGLVKYHSYHIYNLDSYKGINFVCLRNPWGEQEWEGKYSRNYTLIPDDVKKFLDYDHLPLGAFWMTFEDFFNIYNRIVILKPIHPDWNIKMFPILLQKLNDEYDFKSLQTFGIKLKQQIPQGKKCRLHFLVEKRLSFKNLNDYIGPNYKLIIASIDEKEAPKIDFSKIKDEKHFASFYATGDVENFSFDITSNNEIVYVTIRAIKKQKYDEYCYVNVMCKYNFDLYDVDHPEKLFNEVNNPGYVFENISSKKTSKYLTIKNFDNKLSFSLNTINSDGYFDNEERDELIGKLFKYKKLDFKMWQADINMYTKVQEKPLGNGTNGTVFLVKMKSNDKLYAAKVLKESTSLKFLRELSIMRSLRYPSIIQFIAFCNKDFEYEDHPTIITEYMKGGSLYDFIEKVHKGTCSWTSTDKMIILIGIAFGMDYLRNHEIMHRDLKLQNVLLDDNMTPKICDFAESLNYQIELDNGHVEIVGTPLFMAPEIKNGSHYSFQIDVYSFGIIAYYIYTDQFPDESHPVDMDKLDSKFKKFVSSMIDEDPEKRPTFESITKMYLNNFDETWIDGADIEKVEIYLHQLGVTLKSREHHLDLEIIRSITPDVYPANARKPIVDIDEILNNPNLPESLSITLINASIMLQSESTDYVENLNEVRSIYHKAGYIFFMGDTTNEGLIKADPFYAIQFLREASLLKNRDSMYMLSQIFADSDDKECQKIAFKIASMSADLGCPEAERALGKFYLKGIGTDKNVVMAALYFKLAADKGNNESMYLFANTLIRNNIFTRFLQDQGQNEKQAKELECQIEKAQQIVDQMKGMSYKIYKEFLLTKDAISSPAVTLFVAKKYLQNAAKKGVEKANEELLYIEKISAENESEQNIPDFVDDIYGTSISVSIDDDDDY